MPLLQLLVPRRPRPWRARARRRRPRRQWDAAAVSEYLARWQVEEAVQQAVNSAIRLRAVDPVLHVAGFLEARGRVMDEQQQQAAAAAVGSSNVMESRRES